MSRYELELFVVSEKISFTSFYLLYLSKHQSGRSNVLHTRAGLVAASFAFLLMKSCKGC